MNNMSKAIIEEAKEILRKNNQKDFLFMLEKMDDEKKEEIVEQIEENVKSAELELEADDVAYMRELAEAIDKE